jgi:hypothetical protein
MKGFLFAAVLALLPARAFAQAPDAGLATPTGHELNLSLGGYHYVEPAPQRVSIHGLKVAGEYTGTWSLNERRHWFFQADVRGALGRVTYDGYCSPWLITPDSASPNGYVLDLGAASACSESGDADWYVETRALAGRDFFVRRWGLSPYSGAGLRHLSNGTGGVPGYRIDNYLYVPLGITTRTSRRWSVTLEYDRLIRGWQETHESAFGGSAVPATTGAPAFTIDGFTDVSFAQHGGWALRASGAYHLARAWSVEPYYIRWSVGASPANDVTATFTVNGITAREQLGFYEPFNTTNEFGVKLGLHF